MRLLTKSEVRALSPEQRKKMLDEAKEVIQSFAKCDICGAQPMTVNCNNANCDVATI